MTTYYVEYRKDKDDYAVYRNTGYVTPIFISNHSLKELADSKARALSESRLLGQASNFGLWRKQPKTSEVTYD